MRSDSSNNSASLHQQVLFTLSVAILCFAPLMRGGRMASALMILEILGVILLIVSLWYPHPKKSIPALAWALIISGLLLPLLYLMPLPTGLSLQLPGRSLYLESVAVLTDAGMAVNYLPLSLIPSRTLTALLALLPVIGIFMATLLLPKHYVIRLVYVFLGVATFQASLGLIQYGSGAEWAFWWELTASKNVATGTYPNRDHFSGLLEMAIPIALGLTAYSFRHKKHEDHDNQQHFNQTLIFFTVSLVLILGGIFARSRTGVALVMLALLLCSFLFARHIGGKRALGFGASITVIAIGIASNIGLIPVLNRFAVDPVEDLRWEIFDQTWQATKHFFPFGSGPGTFQSVFMAFQPPEIHDFVNHAHNDYLEFLLETGLLGGVIMVLFLALYAVGWFKLYQQRKSRDAWGYFYFIQISAGISILLLALHGLTDFNFHTPANSIFFAFLGSIFLYQSNKKPSK
ncbi:O-antigen ligase family protein [Thiothrix lacustris]|uniref:O-antigen ligase family protein n=1 Tax=Thiothrix lacustris TaxID=525917 RepID=UPI0027E540D9|nr:O-antigen ligase family protein [Thiothrix lacustris]WMP17970.1 O-antigen ligase family protein [Thiothrix lacustris]